MKVFVAGSTGFLGGWLVPFLEERGHHVFAGRFGNFTAQEVVRNCLDVLKPDAIVNLIALTDVDRCERNPVEAFEKNVLVVKYICDWIREKSPMTHLVQISTDQVYDGVGPHSEENFMPSNVYAKTKKFGEEIASSINATVLRTNFLGHSKSCNRRSFVDWLIDAVRHKEQVPVFKDVLFSPVSISTLINVVELCLIRQLPGIYNVGAQSGLSKADLAFKFASIRGMSTDKFVSISVTQAENLVAYRSRDMRMNSAKFEKSFGFKLGSIEEELKIVVRDYESAY